MGASNAENIALQIASTADTQAIKDSRADVSALGKAAKDASDEMVAGFDQASDSSAKLTDAVQEHGEAAERSTGNVRSLSIEVSHLALAFEEGRGGALGMVRAASLAATEIAELSGVVEIAAGATVIGALVAVVGTVISLFHTASDATDKYSESLSRLNTETQSQLAIEEEQATKQLTYVNQQIEANNRLIASAGAAAGKTLMQGGILNPASLLKTGDIQKQNNDLIAQQKALSDRLTAIYDAEAKLKQQDDDAVAAHKRQLDAEAEREAIQSQQRAKTLLGQMTEDQQEAIDEVTLSQEDAAIQKQIRDEKAREQEIRDLKISEDEKTTLILAAQADRDARIAAIHKRSVDAQKAADDAAAAAAQAAQDAALKRRIDTEAAVLQQSISANESFAKTMTRLLLTPLEKYLEGLAAKQLVEAAASAASFDFVGAALHLAAAAAATEAARLVSQIGGLNSSGSSGSAPASSAAGSAISSNALSPTPAQQQGNVVVNLLTTNPYSRENIMIASYELNRAGILNRPIYVPPTSGMQPAT